MKRREIIKGLSALPLVGAVYPKLTPTNYPGNQTGRTILMRLPYLEGEAASNK